MYKEEIQSLEVMVNQQREEFAKNTARLNELKKQQLSHELGIRIGDKISYIDGGVARTGMVCDFYIFYGDAEVCVHPINKDGAPSVVIRRVSRPQTIKKID